MGQITDRDRVLRALGNHLVDGRQSHAIAVERLAQMTGLAPRQLQSILRAMHDDGLIVGANEVGSEDFDNAILVGKGIEMAAHLTTPTSSL